MSRIERVEFRGRMVDLPEPIEIDLEWAKTAFSSSERLFLFLLCESLRKYIDKEKQGEAQKI